jgi:hypothetical protein
MNNKNKMLFFLLNKIIFLKNNFEVQCFDDEKLCQKFTNY